MVVCLKCGKRRSCPDDECPRCAYVGWMPADDLHARLRRRFAERVLTHRRARAAR
jgi:hypothetical protein